MVERCFKFKHSPLPLQTCSVGSENNSEMKHFHVLCSSTLHWEGNGNQFGHISICGATLQIHILSLSVLLPSFHWRGNAKTLSKVYASNTYLTPFNFVAIFPLRTRRKELRWSGGKFLSSEIQCGSQAIEKASSAVDKDDDQIW